MYIVHCTLFLQNFNESIIICKNLIICVGLLDFLNKEYIYEKSTVYKSKKKLFNRNVTVLNKNLFIFYFIL